MCTRSYPAGAAPRCVEESPSRDLPEPERPLSPAPVSLQQAHGTSESAS
jgi:hypothetical protein